MKGFSELFDRLESHVPANKASKEDLNSVFTPDQRDAFLAGWHEMFECCFWCTNVRSHKGKPCPPCNCVSVVSSLS